MKYCKSFKWIIIPSLIFCSTILCIKLFDFNHASEIPTIYPLLDTNKTPSPILLTLLQETSIAHDGSLADIVTKTQKDQPIGWIRPRDAVDKEKSLERWQIADIFVEKQTLFQDLFKKMHLTETIAPQHQYYDYVLLLGSTLQTVRERLAYLLSLYNAGVRFGSIIMLGGKRPLDPAIEKPEEVINAHNGILSFKDNWKLEGNLPQDESEMMQVVFSQSQIPQEWNDIVVFVDTPMQPTAAGGLRRPTTHDTIKTWLSEYNPNGGIILAISNQPYIGYQDSIIRHALPNTFSVETVGKAPHNDLRIAIVLDVLARWLYSEQQSENVK